MKKALLFSLLIIVSLVKAQNYTLTSLVVNGLNENWCGDVEEIYFFGCSGNPDLYVLMYDEDDVLVYQSNTTDDSSDLELTLNIDLNSPSYNIWLYDEDAISSDDLLGVFTFDLSQVGDLILTDSESTITINLLESSEGCTDSNALNYNPDATTNDGTCEYSTDCLNNESLLSIEVVTDNWGYETSIELTGYNGDSFLSITEFSSNTVNNFEVCVPSSGSYLFVINDTYGDGICCDYGSGYYSITICDEIVATGSSFGLEETVTIEACSFDGSELYGCLDSDAINFNPLANESDNSCVYFNCPNDFVPTDENVFFPPEGSTITEYQIQLPIATVGELYEEYIQFYAPNQLEFDGTVIEFNYATINSIGNLPSGVEYQCSNSTCTFNAEETACIGLVGTPTETGVFELEISASVSVSYDAGLLGNVDIDFNIPYYGGNTYLELAGIDANTINSFIPSFVLVVQESDEVFGCTDVEANNYSPLANQDDGSCDYTLVCDDQIALISLTTYSFAYEVSWELQNSLEDIIIASNEVYSNNSTYEYEVCLESEAIYELVMYDSYGDGWSENQIQISIICDEVSNTLVQASLEDNFSDTIEFINSCTIIEGCTDSLAINYNNFANLDDNSCEYPLYGCTNTEAINYDIEAQQDDGSCTYFECNNISDLDEAGFYPPSESTYSADSSTVYLPDALLNVFYEQYLQFYAEDTMSLDGFEIGFISAKILNINNMPTGMYYQTSSVDSTFYSNNVGCVGLFGTPEEPGVYELAIEAQVTVEVLGSPITFNLPYSGGNVLLDLVYSDGDYTTLNNFIPNFVIEVLEIDENELSEGCIDLLAINYNSLADVDDGSCLYSQTITLISGWNLMSTHIDPEFTDITEVFSSLTSDLVIVKNNSGDAYLPEWSYNGIGDMLIGEGYQLKINTSTDLLITGERIFPTINPIELDEGWNLIAYLRLEPVLANLALQDLTESNNLIIAKDNYGNAYLPEWDFNGIGDFESGSGYQLKILNADTLLYLSDEENY